MMHAVRYQSDRESALAYDLRALRYLVDKYIDPLEKGVEVLRRTTFEYKAFTVMLECALDKDIEILYRQCLPLCIASMNCDPQSTHLPDLIATYALCQSLILNTIDRSFDLKRRTPGIEDNRAIVAFALASTHSGILLSQQLPNSQAVLTSSLSTTRFIIQQMHATTTGRYSHSPLIDPSALLAEYEGEHSRHLGSGFYESATLAGLALHGREATRDVVVLLRGMRRLRQRVDEVADLFEDLWGGLVTYPHLLLLSSQARNRARELITGAWSHIRAKRHLEQRMRELGVREACANDPILVSSSRELLQLLIAQGVLQRIVEEANALYSSCSIGIDELASTIGDDFFVLIDLKKAFLDRIVESGWLDYPEGTVLTELRMAALNTRTTRTLERGDA